MNLAVRHPGATFVAGLLAIVVIVEAVGVVAGGAVNNLLLYLPGIDKALHFLAFAAIACVAHRLLRACFPDVRRAPLWVAVLLVLLAGGDELGQGLLSPRNLELADFFANVAGLTFGIALVSGQARPVVSVLCGFAALVLGTWVTFDSYVGQRHLNAGVRFAQAGDFVGARREYQAAFEAGVRTARLFNELGWVEVESGQGDARKAVEYAARALAMRPDDPDTLDTYGWALHHAGRSVDALPYLKRAYAAKPRMFCIHYHLGEVYAALGRSDEARSHFREQITAFPRTSEARRAERALAAAF